MNLPPMIEQNRVMIEVTTEDLIQFFAELEEGGEFSVNEELLWSYFFIDSSPEKLKKLAVKLESLRYIFKDIFEAEKVDEEHVQEYYLQIEKIEKHNVNSLDALNQMFYNLVNDNLITAYDGFDVGNIISTENIVR